MNFTYSPSVTPAVSMAEFRAHLRYPDDVTSEDGDLLLKLSGAIRSIESETGRVLLTTTAVLTLDGWPAEDYIKLPGGQTSSITSVKYTLSTGTQSTWAASNYKLVRAYSLTSPTQVIDTQARLYKGYQIDWPSDTLDTGEPVEVTYVTGFADADSVPYPLKAAVLLEAAHLYRHRESTTLNPSTIESKVIARGVADLIAPYWIGGF